MVKKLTLLLISILVCCIFISGCFWGSNERIKPRENIEDKGIENINLQ